MATDPSIRKFAVLSRDEFVRARYARNPRERASRCRIVGVGRRDITGHVTGLSLNWAARELQVEGIKYKIRHKCVCVKCIRMIVIEIFVASHTYISLYINPVI